MSRKKFSSFRWSDEVEPHKARTKEIITKHPEIRQLIGRNPYTFLVILVAVGILVALAFGVSPLGWDLSWIWTIVLAYFVGAFFCHTLWVCIHEASHNLIFKNKTANIWAGMIANLPHVFPSSVSFAKYHMKHHAYQGVEELDADMPFRWEAKLINNAPVGKAVWLLFYPIFQMLRPMRLKEIKLFDTWTLINWLVQAAFMFAIIYFLGAKAAVFLLASFFFSVGLHPLGARWIQEHFLTHGEQETKSYYGPLNVTNLNVGYHNEHHDFPSVPWNKLPKVKQIAGSYYTTLGFHTSYTGLLFRFLFDGSLSVYSRTAREKRGKRSAKAPHMPADMAAPEELS
ncbi:fatty acid desaturase [Terrimonas sp. NA20]|uniref:Fatty acid desaturase n=1 Tax=Terrimonas ginsenosidimutans TaxID=2908004 RepID=A0ABS9L073_9BACT|nr:fatty acid desaturase [Terrimonas ginsenosidimutans]MCG2617973.1 fatty acid desaturase [Terrimonas ginsenosidimutans]